MHLCTSEMCAGEMFSLTPPLDMPRGAYPDTFINMISPPWGIPKLFYETPLIDANAPHICDALTDICNVFTDYWFRYLETYRWSTHCL